MSQHCIQQHCNHLSVVLRKLYYSKWVKQVQGKVFPGFHNMHACTYALKGGKVERWLSPGFWAGVVWDIDQLRGGGVPQFQMRRLVVIMVRAASKERRWNVKCQLAIWLWVLDWRVACCQAQGFMVWSPASRWL